MGLINFPNVNQTQKKRKKRQQITADASEGLSLF